MCSEVSSRVTDLILTGSIATKSDSQESKNMLIISSNSSKDSSMGYWYET